MTGLFIQKYRMAGFSHCNYLSIADPITINPYQASPCVVPTPPAFHATMLQWVEDPKGFRTGVLDFDRKTKVQIAK